jgi:hypothetical protein
MLASVILKFERNVLFSASSFKPSISRRRRLLSILRDMPRIAQTKNGFAPKICIACGLEFEWRKKWQRDWEYVKYCSEKCKSK